MVVKYNFDSKMYYTVASNIKKERIKKGMDIATLSRYTDIEESYLKQWESLQGDIVISIYDLYKISVILDVSIDKFFK